MKEEQLRNIAIAAIVIIIAVVLSLKLVATYNPDFFNNLFAEEKKIEMGDCVELNYVGRYASNGTVFDTSYEQITKDAGIYNENKTYDPMKAYIAPENNTTPPQGYTNYSTVIEGLKEALIGMKEGQEKNNITIPPGKAYGFYPKIGGSFNFSYRGQLFKFEIVNITENVTMSSMYGGNITTTRFVLRDNSNEVGDNYDLYPFWKNATTITKINETMMWTYTTPTKLENITYPGPQTTMMHPYLPTIPSWPNATSVSFNETTIILTFSPKNNTSFTYMDPIAQTQQQFTIVNITESKIYASNSTDQITTWNRTVEIQRNISQNITYPLPEEQLTQLLQFSDSDVSLHRLAGETLVFDVTIEKIHKTSG